MTTEIHYDWCDLLCYSPYSHSHLLKNNKEKWKGKCVFLFCNKAFQMMTNLFLWRQKASVTNVHRNMFFTMCIKQRKERKRGGEGGWRSEARIESNLGKIWVHESCQESCYSYSQFLTAHLLSRKKTRSFFKPYPQQISLERKHSEWFGMNGCITNFPASLLNIYVVTNDDTGEIF